MHPLNGYILAGGKSSRMGTDKGLIPLDGTTFTGKVLSTLEEVSQKVTIVGAPETYAQFGVELIPDSWPDVGPLGGIHAALQHSSTEWNVIVSCDIPFVSAALIRYLETRIGRETQAVLPHAEDRVHFLAGLYHRSAAAAISDYIAAGERSVKGLIPKLNGKKIMLDDSIAFYDRKILLNFNTPDDLERYIP